MKAPSYWMAMAATVMVLRYCGMTSAFTMPTGRGAHMASAGSGFTGLGRRVCAARAVSASTSCMHLSSTIKNVEDFAIDNRKKNSKDENNNIKKNGPFTSLKKALFVSLLLLNAYMSKFKEFLSQKSSKTASVLGQFVRLFQQSGPSPGKSRSAPNTPMAKLARAFADMPRIAKASIVAIFVYGFKKLLFGVKQITYDVSYADFMKALLTTPDSIKDLRVTSSVFTYAIGDRKMVTRIVDLPPMVLDFLLGSKVDFSAAKPSANVLGIVWACVYAFFIWNVSSRMMQGPQDAGAGSRKDLTIVEKLSFEDVAGQEQAKQEVKEVCDMLRAPLRYKTMGARFPAGVLLVGPPGTGKTLLARVTASEAGVPFYACSASDFVEVFVGRGPARVRKLFKQAAENAPCIVFIDELDSIGRSRRMGSLNSEQESTLNQLLTSMDGLDTSNNGVIVMAATNRYELLDPALLRAGRFDRIIQCPLPDKDGRENILGVHTRKLQLSSDVDLKKISALTSGTCGADLSAITNEAAIRTVRRGGSEVCAADFDSALKSFRMRYNELDPRRYL